MGVDHMLGEKTTSFRTKIRTITGFAARVKRGYFEYRRQVTAGIVSSALTAIGQAGAMDTGVNPLKIMGSNMSSAKSR